MNNQQVICVVDDSSSMRTALKRLMESVGLYVEVFSSAEEFLMSSRVEDSSCLILDHQLPGMSGLDLQARLLVSNPRLPIIFVSGYRDEVPRERALRAGAIDFLQKPFSDEALFAAIDVCLLLCRAGPSRPVPSLLRN